MGVSRFYKATGIYGLKYPPNMERCVINIDGTNWLFKGINSNKSAGIVASRLLINTLNSINVRVSSIKLFYDGIKSPKKYTFNKNKSLKRLKFSYSREARIMSSELRAYCKRRKINFENIFMNKGEGEYQAIISHSLNLPTIVVTCDTDVYHIMAGIKGDIHIMTKPSKKPMEYFHHDNFKWIHMYPKTFRITCLLIGTDYTPQLITTEMASGIYNILKNIHRYDDRIIYHIRQIEHYTKSMEEQLKHIIFILAHLKIKNLKLKESIVNFSDEERANVIEILKWSYDYSLRGQTVSDYDSMYRYVPNIDSINRLSVLASFIRDDSEDKRNLKTLLSQHCLDCNINGN